MNCVDEASIKFEIQTQSSTNIFTISDTKFPITFSNGAEGNQIAVKLSKDAPADIEHHFTLKITLTYTDATQETTFSFEPMYLMKRITGDYTGCLGTLEPGSIV